MEVNYKKWEQNVKCLEINGRTIGVAPEDMIKEDGCELWTLEEAARINKELAGGWRLPNEKEIRVISEQINNLKEGASYWAGTFSPCIFRMDHKTLMADGLRPFVGCRIRCVCDIGSLLD